MIGGRRVGVWPFHANPLGARGKVDEANAALADAAPSVQETHLLVHVLGHADAAARKFLLGPP